MEKTELQEIDIKILDALKHSARKSYEQIASEVGLSRTAVKNRIKALEESKVILGYETKIETANVGQACRFMIDVETNPCDYESVRNLLGESAFITELYAVTGSCHLHAVGMASNQTSMQAYMNRLNRELCNVRRLTISTILSVCKNKDGGVEYVRAEENTEES